MGVAGEVDVDLVLRYDARPAAAGAAPLDAEYRPERRLTERRHDVLADHPQPLREPDAGGRLAFPGRRGVHARHDDELALLLRAHGVQRHLRLGVAEGDEVLGRDAEAPRDLSYRAQFIHTSLPSFLRRQEPRIPSVMPASYPSFPRRRESRATARSRGCIVIPSGVQRSRGISRADVRIPQRSLRDASAPLSMTACALSMTA